MHDRSGESPPHAWLSAFSRRGLSVKLLRLLFRRHRITVILAVVAGGLSGVAGSWMLAVIHEALRSSSPPARLGATFLALCVFSLGARNASELLLLRHAHAAVFELRTSLARQIVTTPLCQIEKIGTARILTVLTDDVHFATAVIPGLLILWPTLAIVVGCLLYMAWLSLALFAVALLGMMIGVATYLAPKRLALPPLRAARAHQEALTGHFTALTSGIKELQQHHGKAHEFLSRILDGTAEKARAQITRGMSIYRAVDNWAQLLFLVVIGIIIFIVPKFRSSSKVGAA